MKKISVLLIVIALGLLFFGVTRNHWWKELPGVTVTVDGVKAQDCHVYGSFSHALIVLIVKDGEEQGLYIVYPQEKRVGHASRSSFKKLPWLLFSHETPPVSVMMGSEKSEAEPYLQVTGNRIEFIDLARNKISISSP